MLAVAATAAAFAGVARAQPAPSADCLALEAKAEAALGATGTLTQEGNVQYIGLPDSPGCLVAFTGTGEVFGPSFQVVASRIGAMLTADGWTADSTAAADGATGTARGYLKANQAIPIAVETFIAPGACPAGQPRASCRPTPAQIRYQITLGLRGGR